MIPKISEEDAAELIEHSKNEVNKTFDQLADGSLTGIDSAKSALSVILNAIKMLAPDAVDGLIDLGTPVLMAQIDRMDSAPRDPVKLRARAATKLRHAEEHESEVEAWSNDGKKQLFESARSKTKLNRAVELRADAALLIAEADALEDV